MRNSIQSLGNGLSVNSIIFVTFASVSILISAAIPPLIRPVSIADIILLVAAPFVFLFVKRPIFLILFASFIWFLMSTALGDIRGYGTSFITSTSLALKWMGATTIYLICADYVRPKSILIRAMTIIQMLVLFSLMSATRVFPDPFYDGHNGIFQASADGGFCLICFLGFFLGIYKIYPTRLIAFNIFITCLSLILVDSRFGILLGVAAMIFYFTLFKKGKIFLIVFLVSTVVLVLYEIIPLPSKIQVFIGGLSDFDRLIGGDMSMLIRVHNFQTAYELSSWPTIIFGNGAKFFQLTTNDFFGGNYSLDNSYIYLILSYGAPLLFFFYRIFLSGDGIHIFGRGPLTILPLTFSLMQDIFSNSFCLLVLVILLALDTVFVRRRVIEV